MNGLLDTINGFLWGTFLVYGLIALGAYYTLRLGALQLRHFPELWRVTVTPSDGDAQGISGLQALWTSLASRVGTGNIAGVAVALVLGGPGAIFWMWVVAFLGMATAYAESALAQLYKQRAPEGAGAVYRGGPAYYIALGLKTPWAGALFAAILIFATGLVVNALQANAIADAMEGAFGLPKLATALGTAALTGLIVFGGIRKVARAAELLVPFMAGCYVLVTLYVLAQNLSQIPALLQLIVIEAFGFGPFSGGVAGGMMAALLNGVKRGLFSNEAGMGSAPNIAAAATPTPHHPAAQGMVQSFAVFIDTIIICTCTALFILLSGIYEPGGALTGTQLTQAALAEHIGPVGPIFVAVAIFFFAFTTIIGCYAYSEMAMGYLGLAGKAPLMLLRSVLLVVLVWGAQQSVKTVFDLADASLGVMAAINMIALVLLAPKVSTITRDYFAQRRKGHAPRFIAEDHPELGQGIDRSIWR